MNELPMAIQSVPAAPAAESGRFYVDFEIRVEEDREETLKAGRFVGRDVDFAVITLPGGKDVRRRPVTDELLNEWRHGRWRGGTQIKPPAPWAIHAYERWKAGREIPENGWALRHWNALSPAQLKTCLAANVRTVEDLAALNDEGVKRLGIGGLHMVRLAREALKQKEGQKDTHKIVALEQDVERLTRQVQELVAVNQDLKRRLERAPAARDVFMPAAMSGAEANGLSPTDGPPPETAKAGAANASANGKMQDGGEDVRAEYVRVFGRKPRANMKPETMRERIRSASAKASRGGEAEQ